MPPLNLLIKPASSLCNLRCEYCFYRSIAENRLRESFGIMSLEVLEQLVKKSLAYAEHSCTFAFQGGEPTLAGLPFFKQLLEFQKKYNKRKIQINNAIQTNGIVIDDEWAEFLSANNFLVGISLDGPKDIHDLNRQDAANRGSYTKVMQAISHFDKHKVEYNILTVVNSATARHIHKIYGFFRKNHFRFLQFIPCLDPLQESPGGHVYSLTPERYAYFLKTLFDLWYNDLAKGEPTSIRYFDNLGEMMMGYPPESCGMAGRCALQFVFEADGSAYPCDFYVFDEWSLGNIKEHDFADLSNSVNGWKFIEASKHIDSNCLACEYVNLCRGGCRRNREPFVEGKPVLNYYCRAYKEFFRYASQRLYQIATLRANMAGIPPF